MVSGVSGKAVELIQTRVDMQTFIYMSNFAKGMKRCGEIWLSIAREIYTEDKRKMKTIAATGEAGMVELMQPMIDQQTGAVVMDNNLTTATFDVIADVGPSSSSKKQATVRALTGMLQLTQDPETNQVITAMAMLNMEGEGLSETNAYFRKKLLRMGVVKPTDDESKELQEEMQQPQPQDPNAVYLQAAAEEATAKAAQARANTVETIASAELKNAQTAQTLAKIGEVQPPISEDAIKALERRKKEVEIEILEVDLVKKLRELEAPEPEMPEPQEETPNYEAQAALAIADAVDGLAESVQGVRSVVESMTASNNQNAGAAIEAVRKPKRVIRENGRIVGIE